jgi:hypothetical protein
MFTLITTVVNGDFNNGVVIRQNDFKRFGTFKGLVEQKNLVFNSFLCKLFVSLAF